MIFILFDSRKVLERCRRTRKVWKLVNIIENTGYCCGDEGRWYRFLVVFVRSSIAVSVCYCLGSLGYIFGIDLDYEFLLILKLIV